jgi:hypothetical protein
MYIPEGLGKIVETAFLAFEVGQPGMIAVWIESPRAERAEQRISCSTKNYHAKP